MGINGWRAMWLVAVYDCPMTSKEARHNYTVFRRQMLKLNFIQLQNSLYLRHFPTKSAVEAAVNRLRLFIPENASVAFFMITDKQYALTKEYFGTKESRIKPVAPEQLEIF
jgi:CRISPR-associated protein Cas2